MRLAFASLAFLAMGLPVLADPPGPKPLAGRSR